MVDMMSGRVVAVMLVLIGCGSAGRARPAAVPVGFWVQQIELGAGCPSGTELWLLDWDHRPMAAVDYPEREPAMGSNPPHGLGLRFSGPNGEVLRSWTTIAGFQLCYFAAIASGEQHCVPLPMAAWCQRDDGVQHGPYVEWYREGDMAVAGSFEDGREQGTWQYWDRSGRLVEERRYVAGKRQRPPGWTSAPLPSPSL